MTLPLAPALQACMASPIVESRAWVKGRTFPADRPLINVSQAAPVAAPPEGLRQAMAEAILSDTSAHLYGPVLGNDPLREALAARVARLYGARTGAANVAITAGCNMAFCATIASLAAPGDEVILPCPWYFNHAMWLDMAGIVTRPLETGDDLLPDPEEAAALIGPRTRAIVLVSPNNPGGVEYPPALLDAFRDLCRARGIALIIDETYRDFLAAGGRPHDLLADPDWDDTVIQLYSFSKAYRLTGHRVGAILAAPRQIAEIEKFLDTMVICVAQPGQIGALWGLENLDGWLAAERAEILARRAALEAAMTRLPGWRLRGIGAYFAYLEHPFATDATDLCRRMVDEAGVLALPGSFFGPAGRARGARELRIAFANVDAAGIDALAGRLAGLPFALASPGPSG
ncbi:aminotransferase [Mangrovicoccus algicola]|uniref:aspartate transaminase n=1 Tax=Mangrovicoccus algicola TaxID=2771008 RepID=A0A8J7D159_9RHOB|nr:aminotransferase [Mangrovicoccus algicola]MBE3640378.1 aminotransferase [Mangrovicoccus algicola]